MFSDIEASNDNFFDLYVTKRNLTSEKWLLLAEYFCLSISSHIGGFNTY